LKLQALSAQKLCHAWQVLGEIMTALKDSPAALSALVPNLKGYEMARDAGAKIISVVPSATETMNRKNINMGYEDILALSCDLMQRAKDDGIKGQAYVSVAFECPFEGQVSQDRVMEMTETLLEAGAQEIIIADTIGAANPSQVKSLFDRLTASFDKKYLLRIFTIPAQWVSPMLMPPLSAGLENLMPQLAGLAVVHSHRAQRVILLPKIWSAWRIKWALKQVLMRKLSWTHQILLVRLSVSRLVGVWPDGWPIRCPNKQTVSQ
jgi:hypothetical protein